MWTSSLEHSSLEHFYQVIFRQGHCGTGARRNTFERLHQYLALFLEARKFGVETETLLGPESTQQKLYLILKWLEYIFFEFMGQCFFENRIQDGRMIQWPWTLIYPFKVNQSIVYQIAHMVDFIILKWFYLSI